MEITPRELRDIDIRPEMRGYSKEEVNDLLERAAMTIEAANERVTQLQERLATAQTEAGRTRETEEILHRTLLLAQRAADEAVAEATTKSRSMLDDAEIQARRLVADAEAEARRKGEAERRRLEEEVLDLAGRRDALLADVEALNRFEAEYRERMVRALEADLFALRSRPTSAPGTRPEPSDVELPVPGEMSGREASAQQAQPQGQPQTAPAAAEDDEVVSTIVHDEPEPEAISAPAEPVVSDATHEVDVRSLFEQAGDATPREPDEGLQPIDLLGSDGADADVLDDDAFFATLRDAVHDNAPLGPRDENDVTGDHRFFDQDDDRGSFRDVFRRRR